MEAIKLSDTLSVKKKMLEYREANDLLIYYGNISWIANSIFYSAAFAIIGLTWQETKWLPLVFFAVTSGSLWFFAWLVGKRLQFFCDEILILLWRLEQEMDLTVHLNIKSRDKEEDEKSRFHKKNKIGKQRWIMLGILAILWGVRIFFAYLTAVQDTSSSQMLGS